MDWEKQQQQQEDVMNGGGGVGLGGGGGGGNGMFVKVMTDEQMETLRKQIAAYATICEKLVEWHKSLTSHPEFSGARLGNLYCDPLVTSVGHKITGRQRWTPTPVQLQILERIFDLGTGTPSKQKVKEITCELIQHGQISETNVYNWFQNRRARSKRKQQASANNNGESEVETEVESFNEKQHTKSEDFPSQPNLASPRPEDLCFQNPEISSAMHSVDSQANKVEQMYLSNGCSKPGSSMGQMSYYDGILAAPRIDHLVGKMEASSSYNQYMQQDEYNLTS